MRSMGQRIAWVGLAAAVGCASSVSLVDQNGASVDAALPIDTTVADREPATCPLPVDGPLRTPPTGAGAVVEVDEDIAFGCVLRRDGRIRCRGSGIHGLFADGLDEGSRGNRMVTLPGLDDVRSFDVSAFVGCAVRGDGSVWCWGDNTGGRVHPDLPRRMLLPTRVPGIDGARRVANGVLWMRPCVLLDGGRVHCWGAGVLPPEDEGRAIDVLSLATHVCIRYEGDRARCNVGGDGGVVTLGEGAATQLSAGTSFVCATDRAGSVSCWGYVPPNSRPVPTPADVGVRCATSIASGAFHTCASLTDGTVTCWGDNRYGQRGPGVTDPAPSRVPGIDRVVRVFRTASSSCALRDDGSLWCWGDGPITGYSHPAGLGVPFRVEW